MLTELQQEAVDRCRGNLADFYQIPAGQRGDRAPEFCGVFSVNVAQLLDVIAELAASDGPPEYDPDGEAERIAEVYDEARAELDRGL